MCLFRPVNIVLGFVGAALIAVGAYIFFACLPTHVGIPNTFDIILLGSGLFLAALHFGVLCCESTRCCLCLYQTLTGVLASCELVITVLFFIPTVRNELVNSTEHLIANASSGKTVVCNLTGLVEDASATGGTNTPLYFAAVMLGLVLLQVFLIMVAGCHGDVLHNEKFDKLDEERKAALLAHQSRPEDNVGVRQYKKKHQAIFDKYNNRGKNKKKKSVGRKEQPPQELRDSV